VNVGVAARGVFVGGRVFVAVGGSGVLVVGVGVAVSRIGVVRSSVARGVPLGVSAQSRTAAQRISGAKICPRHAKSAMRMPRSVMNVWLVTRSFIDWLDQPANQNTILAEVCQWKR